MFVPFCNFWLFENAQLSECSCGLIRIRCWNFLIQVPPVENSPSKENDTEELRGVTEDLATGELFQGPEDITSTLPTVKARTEAACLRDKVINESSEAEAAGKRMHDENGLATDLESTKNTSKSVEMTHIDVHNDNRTNEEQPVRAKHTAELVQNVYSRKEDGALSKSLIHFRSVDNTSDMFESVKSLRNEKTNERLNEVYPELALVTSMYLFNCLEYDTAMVELKIAF